MDNRILEGISKHHLKNQFLKVDCSILLALQLELLYLLDSNNLEDKPSIHLDLFFLIYNHQMFQQGKGNLGMLHQRGNNMLNHKL